MKSERTQIAQRFRSEGEGQAARILGRKERRLREVESEAYRKVQEVRGAADAEATRIYAEAYDKNVEAREFYGFLKTLDTYRSDFSGTSASTPMASGAVALMLAANRALTWRDVRLILAATARKNDPDNTDPDLGWVTGTGGRRDFSPLYGFGQHLAVGGRQHRARAMRPLRPGTRSAIPDRDPRSAQCWRADCP
jgi:hypothetical protein